MNTRSPQPSSAGTLLVAGVSVLLGGVLALFGLAFGFGGVILGPIVTVILSLMAFLVGLRFALKGKSGLSRSLGGIIAAGAFVWAAVSVVGEAGYG
jgi:hypothetical protein